MSYPNLACTQHGLGTLINPSIVSGDIKLALNDGQQFPALQDGQFFYAFLMNPCQTVCEQVKVTAVSGDTLTITRTGTNCFPVGSRLFFDNQSDAALAERLSGLVQNAALPLVFQNGNLTLDLDALKTQLKNLVLNAQEPLQYDGQSGNITFDADNFLNTNKATILSWFSGVSPLDYDSATGAFSIDIAALKTALGITTT